MQIPFNSEILKASAYQNLPFSIKLKSRGLLPDSMNSIRYLLDTDLKI